MGAPRVTPQEIVQMHQLYKQLGNYAAVGRAMGRSASTVSKYVQFGVNVFGIDPNQEPMAIAHQAIDRLSEFLFDTLGLSRTLTEIGITAKHFPIMAKKACGGKILPGFKHLTPADVEKIFEMCL